MHAKPRACAGSALFLELALGFFGGLLRLFCGVFAGTDADAMAAQANRFDLLVDTVLHELPDDAARTGAHAGRHALLARLPDGFDVSPFALALGRRSIAGSGGGGTRETTEMLDFCAEHAITADVEIVAPADIDTALARLAATSKYRFAIDPPEPDRHAPVEDPRYRANTPWTPEMFTAPAVERIKLKAGRERMATVPYFEGLLSGDIDAEVAVAELALDDDQRHAFARRFDRVRDRLERSGLGSTERVKPSPTDIAARGPGMAARAGSAA